MRVGKVEEPCKPPIRIESNDSMNKNINCTHTQSFRIVNVIIISPKERYESFSMISSNDLKMKMRVSSDAMKSRKKNFNDGNTFHF